MDYNLIYRPAGGRGLLRRLRPRAHHPGRRHAEALDARLRDYHEKTRPVLELFRRKEVVHDVDAQSSADDVQSAIRTTLGLPPYKS